MSAIKQKRSRSKSQKESIGLLACGAFGPWVIDIDDETVSGRDRWFAQFDGPSVYLRFEIPSLEIIAQAIRFLTAGEGELALGSDKQTRVNLIRDDEFADRFFLVVEGKSGLHIRFTVAGDDLKNLTEALQQAKEELETE